MTNESEDHDMARLATEPYSNLNLQTDTTHGDDQAQVAMSESADQQVGSVCPAAEFEQLIHEYQSALIRYAYKILRNNETAQDIVQEAFLRYAKNPPQYGVPRQKASWLFRVTHNLCIDLLKRESKRSDIYDKVEKPKPDFIPSEGIIAREGWEQLAVFLERLSDNQRCVVILFFQEDKSYKEIAEQTGLSLSNVGMLLHRGLKKLKAIMEEEEWPA
jgi:RNA polymerase sigma factor (sigma-70 family)